ncbi:MAG: 23S rRNA (uracil(1939)-C(5))-methyltransferase RlmD [Ignavibacteriales bacterium]
MKNNLRIEITGLNHQGEGVGRADGVVYFVPFTVPGDVVDIEETERMRRYRRGRILNVVHPSDDRTEPACLIQENCGGCGLHHMNYPAELSLKTRLVVDSLERIGHLSGVKVNRTMGMLNPNNYRNKVTFHIQHDPKMSLGFYQSGSHQVVPVRDCQIISPEMIEVVNVLEAAMAENPEGLQDLTEVVVRQSYHTREIMIIFMTNTEIQTANVKDIASKAMRVIPQITTVAIMAPTGQPWIIEGSGHLNDKMAGLNFTISPGAFFQTNTQMAEILANKVLEYADLTGHEIVIDGYCGIGTLALPLAKMAGKVIGVELNQAAIDDALDNAAANGLTNTEFVTGNCAEAIPYLLAHSKDIDLVVLDPPRQGVEKPVLEALVNNRPPRIIYVSCHPGTLARDLQQLVQGGYVITEVQPIDMFPHTPHVECVVLMSRV